MKSLEVSYCVIQRKSLPIRNERLLDNLKITKNEILKIVHLRGFLEKATRFTKTMGQL